MKDIAWKKIFYLLTSQLSSLSQFTNLIWSDLILKSKASLID